MIGPQSISRAIAIKAALACGILLGAVLSGLAHTEESAPPVDRAFPRYAVYLFEVAPDRPVPVDWSALQLPGLVPQEPTPFKGDPNAYSDQLYTAVLDMHQLAGLQSGMAAQGRVGAQGPLYLSAPWGETSRYRQRRKLTYLAQIASPVQREARPRKSAKPPQLLTLNNLRQFPEDADPYKAVITETAEVSFEVALIGELAQETAQHRLRLTWTQVIGWEKRTRASGREQANPAHQGTRLAPMLATLVLEHRFALKPGEALFLGGIQGLTVSPDGSPDRYAEIAVVIQVLEG